jgi:hypothetical protein
VASTGGEAWRGELVRRWSCSDALCPSGDAVAATAAANWRGGLGHVAGETDVGVWDWLTRAQKAMWQRWANGALGAGPGWGSGQQRGWHRAVALAAVAGVQRRLGKRSCWADRWGTLLRCCG